MKTRFGNFIKSDIFPMLLLVLIAAIPRIYLLLVTERFSGDGVAYLTTSIYLRDPELIGEVPKRVYFILHPFLTLIIDAFVKDITLASRILNFIIGTSIPPLVYLLGRKFLMRHVAFIAGLFCAFSPMLIEQSAEIRGDNLFALTTLIAILFFESVDWSKTRPRDSIIMGFLIGLSQLARTNGLMHLLVVIPIWLWRIKKGAIQSKPWFTRTLIPTLIVVSLMYAIPYIFLEVRGEEKPSIFVYAFLDGNIGAIADREDVFFRLNAYATEYQILEDVSETSVVDIFSDPQLLITKYTNSFVEVLKLLFDPILNIIMQLSFLLLPLVFYVFYYWGEVKVPSEIKRLIFWAWPSFVILPAIINIVDIYFISLVPILMLILAWLIGTISELGWISKWRNLILLTLTIIYLSISISNALTMIDQHKDYTNPYIKAGKWLNQNTDQNDRIMARNPEIFFHAFRRGYRMPSENLARTLHFIHHKEIKYIIFGPTEQNLRQELFVEVYQEIRLKGDKAAFELVNAIDTGEDIVYILKVRDHYDTDF